MFKEVSINSKLKFINRKDMITNNVSDDEKRKKAAAKTIKNTPVETFCPILIDIFSIESEETAEQTSAKEIKIDVLKVLIFLSNNTS
ncbi:hypothetical protein [Enterococcus faecalis]|uniref:hypothetical protein n=1 Tax=Enterococcus faecalis TaxID=1351 RepID=UPI0003730AF4|nr:hypothetical protein D350_00447 [Enterococcus faecalis VC1B-1]HAP3793378.1 hypothetical protein [Enterococcus faecalis]